MYWFPMFLVFGTVTINDILWYPQFDDSIDTSSPSCWVYFCIVMLRCDLVSEEAGCTGMCMRNQGLFLAHFQLEFLLQEFSQLFLNLFRLYLWPRKSEQEIIGVAHISQSPIFGVVRVS